MTALSFKQHTEIQSQFFTLLFNNPNTPRESIKVFVEGFMTDNQQDATFDILSKDPSQMGRYTRLMYILTITIYAETSSNALFDLKIPKYFEKLCMNEPVCRNLLTQSMDIQFKEVMNLILNVNAGGSDIDVCHGYRIALTLLYLYYIRLYYQHDEFKESPLVSAQNALFVDNFYNKRVPVNDLRETTSMVHVQFIIVQFAIVTFYLYTNFITVYYRESDEQCVEVQKAFQTVCKVVEVDIASKASDNFKELVMTVGYHYDKRYRVLNTIRRIGYTKDAYIRYLQLRGKFVMNQYFNMDCAYQYMGPIKKYVAGKITYSEYFKRFVHFEDTFPFYSLHRFEAFRKKLNQLALGYNAMGYYKGKVISFGNDIKNFIKAPFCATWAIIVGIYNFIAVNTAAACDDVSQAYADFTVAGVRFQSKVSSDDENQNEEYIIGTQIKDMAIGWMCKPIFIIFYALRVVIYGLGKTFNLTGHTLLTISELFGKANSYLVTEPARKVPKIDKIAGRKVILRPLEKASRPAMLAVAFDRFGVEPTRVFHMHKLPVVVGNTKDSNVLPTPDDIVGGKKRLYEMILDVDKTVENERILDIIRDVQQQTGGSGSEDIEEELQSINPKDIKPIEEATITELEDYFYNHEDEIDIKQNALSMTLGYHIQEIPEFIVNKMNIKAMMKRCEDAGVKYVGPTFSDYTMVPLSIPNENDCATFIPAPRDDYGSSGMYVLPIVKELEQVLTSINLPAIVPMAR